MRIKVLGGGWYGCGLAEHLLANGHSVTLHEKADHLFAGASGANPARLHQGFHYPRSSATRAFCQTYAPKFEQKYGFLTRAVPVNLYAIAEHDSLMDFGNYVKVLRGEVDFVPVLRPKGFGLRNVEGALQTNERHIVADLARAHFEKALAGHVAYEAADHEFVSDDGYDLTIDCTFCARDSENIDRFEPCLTVLLEGRSDIAVTIMDGPFPSVYPWNEDRGISSLTSARYTPISKSCATYEEARAVLGAQTKSDLTARGALMLEQMAHFWPECRDIYKPVEYRTAVRAMPRSGADARLVDVVRTGAKRLRIRAGKIDAVLYACTLIDGHIGQTSEAARSSAARA